MGKYINIGNADFKSVRKDEYVDKSMLISYVNKVLGTQRKFLCVTRARRFGKSIAAKMLNAYYDQSDNSRVLFSDLKIAQDSSFAQNLNQFPVIYLDVTRFTTKCEQNINTVLNVMNRELIADIASIYPQVKMDDENDLPALLIDIVEYTHQPFIMIIDEWDAICRETKDETIVRRYVDWLRSLFKSGFSDRVFAGVYITGILPIKQYNTQSALNNFEEFSMVNPGPLAGYFGFTQEEVHQLAQKYSMDKEELKRWYDGYQLGNERAIYNPFAVMRAVQRHSIEKYWSSTSTYDALKQYILMDFDGLYESILSLVAGDAVKVNVMNFTNDMHEITSRDAVITLLIHLGYLSYDYATETAKIPNYEVRCEFENTIRDTNWKYLAQIINNSAQLLQDTLAGKERAVELAIEQAHQDHTSILRYNDENSLSCALSLAYVAAYKDFDLVREVPMGKGYADIVLMPKRNVNYPALVLELKWNQSPETAINQIKEKDYAGALAKYAGEVLLVGINYNKKTKKHSCRIEKFVKSNTYCVKSNTKSNIIANLTRQQHEVLQYCSPNAHTANEIFSHLGITVQAKHYATYINALLQIGLLKDATPEKKRNKKYLANLYEFGI